MSVRMYLHCKLLDFFILFPSLLNFDPAEPLSTERRGIFSLHGSFIFKSFLLSSFLFKTTTADNCTEC